MTAPLDHCPELEQLFEELAEGSGPALEHAKSCEACKAILEEHRQLEKDLYRLADPLPPPDLVQKVMTRVEKEPRPIASELKAGVFILTVSLAIAVIAFIGAGAGLGTVGTQVASLVLHARTFFAALGISLSSLWSTAAIPVTVASLLALFITLFGLRRLAFGNGSEARV